MCAALGLLQAVRGPGIATEVLHNIRGHPCSCLGACRSMVHAIDSAYCLCWTASPVCTAEACMAGQDTPPRQQHLEQPANRMICVDRQSERPLNGRSPVLWCYSGPARRAQNAGVSRDTASNCQRLTTWSLLRDYKPVRYSRGDIEERRHMHASLEGSPWSQVHSIRELLHCTLSLP